MLNKDRYIEYVGADYKKHTVQITRPLETIAEWDNKNVDRMVKVMIKAKKSVLSIISKSGYTVDEIDRSRFIVVLRRNQSLSKLRRVLEANNVSLSKTAFLIKGGK